MDTDDQPTTTRTAAERGAMTEPQCGKPTANSRQPTEFDHAPVDPRTAKLGASYTRAWRDGYRAAWADIRASMSPPHDGPLAVYPRDEGGCIVLPSHGATWADEWHRPYDEALHGSQRAWKRQRYEMIAGLFETLTGPKRRGDTFSAQSLRNRKPKQAVALIMKIQGVSESTVYRAIRSRKV